MYELITPGSYVLVVLLWLIILGLYLGKLRKLKAIDGAIAVLLTILAIDAFRTLFENIYFGIYFASLNGLISEDVHKILFHPGMIAIPKVINVVAGLMVLFLLIHRWIPREIRKREIWIKDLKEAKKLADEKKEEAEKSNRVKTDFLASMSHELRTPLNAVLGFAQILKLNSKDTLSQNQNEYIDGIMKGGTQLLELVNEILDLASVEAHQFDLSLCQVDATEILSHSLDLTALQRKQRHIGIIDQFSSLSPVFLFTDPVRLQQVIINLLSNAIKFNKQDGTVTVACRITARDFLRISITDSGTGIAKEDNSGVFHLFKSIGSNPTLAKEGAGIGLAVSKLLVERMAGSIGFESEYGVGSTFWIEMPLASNRDVLIWTQSMRTGIDAIDRDHQTLISLLNKITSLPADDDDIDVIMEKLVDYTHYHFQREEAIMEICFYPELEEHRNDHKAIAARVDELAGKWFRSHNPELLTQIHKFLRDWLFNHIIRSDTKISGYTKGKGTEIRRCLEAIEATDTMTCPDNS